MIELFVLILIMLAAMGYAWLLYALMFNTPLWIIKILWDVGLSDWRYVTEEDTDEPFCTVCGRRKAYSVTFSYDPTNGKVKSATARIWCHSHHHSSRTVAVSPASAKKPVQYK